LLKRTPEEPLALFVTGNAIKSAGAFKALGDDLQEFLRG
jgi:hypothetical protein